MMNIEEVLTNLRLALDCLIDSATHGLAEEEALALAAQALAAFAITDESPRSIELRTECELCIMNVGQVVE